MEKIVKRLKALRLTIEEMLALAGTAGLTYGVVYQGQVVHRDKFEYRDVAGKLPVDEDTMFQVASLTKNMVAAAVGMLVNEGKLCWDTPIKNILPEWNIQDTAVHNLTTILDYLAHRIGLQMNNYWLQSNNNIVIPKEDSMKLINGLKPVKPFRGQFQYNNLGYEIAGHVIEQLPGQTWNEMLQSRLFDQLDMTRTGTNQKFSGPDNVSKAYGSLSNGLPVLVGDPQIGNDTIAGSAGGVRSTLNEILKLTQAWLRAAKHQFENHGSSTSDSPLRQVTRILSSQIPIQSPSYHEISYGLGFARTQLPGPMGAVGLDGNWLLGPAGALDGFPLVGKSAPSQLIIYHQGSHPGVLAALNLIPKSQTGLVILSNTLALVDIADWVGQLLIETVLDVPEKNDYLQITKDTVARALSWFPLIYKEL